MEDYVYVSKGAIEMVSKVYQALLLAKERLADVVYGSENQWREEKLKRTLDDINELCKKYPWLREADGISYKLTMMIHVCPKIFFSPRKKYKNKNC